MKRIHSYQPKKQIKIGDIVVVTHPEYYTFGPGGVYGLVVDIEESKPSRRVTFIQKDSLICFYEEDLGVLE